MKLSVIIPIYNSEKSIEELINKLTTDLLGLTFEVILVVDGSPDNSEKKCFELAEKHENISCISLRKNFGEFNSILCGLNYSIGEYSILIDDDFQQETSDIRKLLSKIEEGKFDVVYGSYEIKKHAFYRNIGSSLVDFLGTILFQKPADLKLTSFKIIKRDLYLEMIKFKDSAPYLDGIIFQITNNIGSVIVNHTERKYGSSNYTFSKLFVLLLNFVFGYSLIPIRIIFGIGVFSFLISILFLALKLSSHINSYLPSLIIFMGSIQLLSLSLLGEYIGKSHEINSNKPQYLIKKAIFKNHAN